MADKPMTTTRVERFFWMCMAIGAGIVVLGLGLFILTFAVVAIFGAFGVGPLQ